MKTIFEEKTVIAEVGESQPWQQFETLREITFTCGPMCKLLRKFIFSCFFADCKASLMVV